MSRTVLVTGASRGLGKEIAIEFSKNGWRVCVTFFESTGLAKDLQKEIDCDTFQCDVSNRESVHNMMKNINRLDVVINNSGINKNQLLLRTAPKDWNEVIGVNLTGAFNVCREAIKIMRNNGGHIINISSIAGLKGREGQCHYSASKAGLIGFSKALAKEVARWNIKVNAVFPGYMKTDMVSGEIIKRAEEENILKRINHPSDIAKFIYQLVQTDFISGQVFNLDSRII